MKADWKQVWSKSKSDTLDVTKPSLFGSWLAEDIAGKGVIDNAQTTLELTENGSVSGNTCVNNFGGKATIEGQKIVFGPLVMTRRAGPPALMDQESRYSNALEKVVGFRLDENGLLFLVDADKKAVLRFSKMKK